MADALFEYDVTPKHVPCGGGKVALTIKVSNTTGDAVDCPQIAIELPHGQDGFLVDDPASIGLAVLPPASWQLTAGDDEWTFVAAPVGVATGLGAGQVLGLVLSNLTIDATSGGVGLEVTETTDQERFKSVGVTKEPRQAGITSFTADSLFVAPHATVEISWSASNAAGCTLSWDGSDYKGQANDSHSVSLPDTTTLTLTADGAGQAPPEELTVTVANPRVISFEANPGIVGQGGTSVLSWETVYAQDVTLDWPGIPKPISVAEQNSSYPVPLDRTKNFYLAAGGVGGGDSLPQRVVVAPVEIVRPFTARANSLAPGSEVVLDWQIAYASGCSIDQGVGPVGPLGPLTVTPPTETAYVLTAAGLDPLTQTAAAPMAPGVTFLSLRRQGTVNISLGWASTAAMWRLVGEAGGQIPIDEGWSGGSGQRPFYDGSFIGTLALTSASGATVIVSVLFCASDDAPDAEILVKSAVGVNSPTVANLTWSTRTDSGKPAVSYFTTTTSNDLASDSGSVDIPQSGPVSYPGPLYSFGATLNPQEPRLSMGLAVQPNQPPPGAAAP